MPLKKYLRGDVWWLRGTVRKQAINETTGTSDEKRAERLRAKREAELWDRSVDGPARHATLNEAAILYLESEVRADSTKYYLGRILKVLGDKKLESIDQLALDAAYAKILGVNASNATKVRAVLTPLRAVMEHAARRKLCSRPAFETPSIAKTKKPVVTPAMARKLIACAAPHLKPLLIFLIGTGCRMSEALELDWSSTDLTGKRAVVWQKQGTERYVDLPPSVVAALSALPHREGRVFRPARHNSTAQRHQEGGYRDTGREGGGQIRTAWASACARAGLPGEWHEYPRPDRPGKFVRKFTPDLTPHGLRSVFASWHYCVHKDLRKLQDDGAWETISMVAHYTKVMPSHYRDEILAFWNGAPAEKMKDTA